MWGVEKLTIAYLLVSKAGMCWYKQCSIFLGECMIYTLTCIAQSDAVSFVVFYLVLDVYKTTKWMFSYKLHIAVCFLCWYSGYRSKIVYIVFFLQVLTLSYKAIWDSLKLNCISINDLKGIRIMDKIRDVGRHKLPFLWYASRNSS